MADSSETVKKNPSEEYEIPRLLHIVNCNLSDINKPANIQPDANANSETIIVQNEISTEDREQLVESILSQIGSLNSVGEKSNTLDNSNITNSKVITAFTNDLRASLNERSRMKNTNTEESSNINLDPLPSTRPSSSVLGSQHNLPLKNNNELDNSTKENVVHEPIIAGNATLRLHKTQTNLHSSKANIPLVINNALLNLLRQPGGIEDSPAIVTYTNVNSDSTRVK